VCELALLESLLLDQLILLVQAPLKQDLLLSDSFLVLILLVGVDFLDEHLHLVFVLLDHVLHLDADLHCPLLKVLPFFLLLHLLDVLADLLGLGVTGVRGTYFFCLERRSWMVERLRSSELGLKARERECWR